MLFGNTLINVREDEERKTTALSGDDGTMTEFPHQGLDGLHVVLSPAQLPEGRVQLSPRPIHFIFHQPQLYSQDGAVELVVPLGHQAVMELFAHTEHHFTEDFPSGSTQFNLLQFQKVQRCCKKFLEIREENQQADEDISHCPTKLTLTDDYQLMHLDHKQPFHDAVRTLEHKRSRKVPQLDGLAVPVVLGDLLPDLHDVLRFGALDLKTGKP
ncbi:hypothetical protein EYF80_057657 [Liparis tanakae]|uniref:Uncharacterized protein n=1 Tax=Liparis tanakae TaxID=230148 RepID=A0A4Z2EUZ4_9TELE|nr:hypothetical protein EYF80_057657 [Liparis tanakae]